MTEKAALSERKRALIAALDILKREGVTGLITDNTRIVWLDEHEAEDRLMRRLARGNKRRNYMRDYMERRRARK
jgi:predicted HAD superfamily phosphohydrolase YqeG